MASDLRIRIEIEYYKLFFRCESARGLLEVEIVLARLTTDFLQLLQNLGEVFF